MLAYEMQEGSEDMVVGDLTTGEETSTIRETPRESRGKVVLKSAKAKVTKVVPTLRPGYQYRQANWEIGRAAERANIKVEPFKPGDRFAAWRKKNIRVAKNAERRGMRKR